MEEDKVLNVAIVGGGPGCKAIMDMIFAEKLSQPRMKLIGVACTNPKAMGYRYAKKKKIYTTRDYRDLYKLKNLNMIIELTGREEVADEIFRTKPEGVRLMGNVAARLFWDIFQIEEERIAERKRADEELKKREIESTKLSAIAKEQEAFQEWINTFDTFVGKFDPNGIMFFCNEAPIKVGGLTKEDIFGKYFPDIMWWSHSETERAKIVECLKRAKAGLSSRIETNFRSANGTPVPVIFNCQPVVDKEGNVEYITAEGKIVTKEVELRTKLEEAKEDLETRVQERTAELRKANKQLRQEITERKQAEEALRESERKYRTLFEDSRDAIYITSRGGEFVHVNQSALDLFGYTRKKMVGLDVLKIYVDPDDRRRFQEEIEEKGSVKNYEVKFCKKDGTEMDCLLTSTVRRADDGSILGYQGIIRDVTEGKRLETQLRQAQKMEAIGTLSGGIAHDFNNLLMGIQGRTSLMSLDIDHTHPNLEHLKGIEDLVKRGADLTQQLLGFARGGKYEVKPTDLNEFIQNSSEMFGRTKKEIRIHRKYQKKIWRVEVDRGQIEQVLLNLYVNAWQAMPRGGDLYLQTENITLDENYVKPYNRQPGRYVKISVTDTGAGIDEATQQRIFDPFFTTKEGDWGTGLGLASAYGIIKNHGGIINVYSKKGHGSTFNIYLPAAKAAVTEEESVVREEEIRRGSETILLVDDEQSIIDVAKELLSKLGYKVLLASGGEEALDIYKTNKDRIDMVILDMIMPGMGGGEVYDRMKGINPNVKVLLSSGYSIDGQATEILKRGCDGFIQKPFNLKQLSQSIRKILRL